MNQEFAQLLLAKTNVKYFVDHKEVSEAECSLATDEWMELPYADWYECVDENIDVVFSLDINDT